MGFRAGDAYYCEFVVSGPGGATVNADSTPTAGVYHNGTLDGSFTLTVANPVTGLYTLSGTVPSGYSGGDVFNTVVAATVSTVSTQAVVDRQVIDRLPALQKNAAFGFSFRMFSSTAPYTAAYTSGSVTGTRTLSGGASSAVTGTITQIASTNEYYFAGAAADCNSGEAHFAFTASGALPVYITLNPSP